MRRDTQKGAYHMKSYRVPTVKLIALSPDGEDLIRTSPVSLIPEGYGESDNWLDLMN